MPDACSDRHVLAAQDHRRPHGGGELLGHPLGLGGSGRRVEPEERDEELVAAEPGEKVTAPEPAAQRRRHVLQAVRRPRRGRTGR